MSNTLGSVVLLLICLVAVNVMASFIPLRFDLTEERLYTISDGSRKILESLQEPVRINFYYSRNNAELPPNFKTYAQRVQELLEEYAAISNGQLILEISDPKPDTEEEEWAQKYGIKSITLPSGNTVYFGAVVSMLDQEMLLPYFDQRRQEFLEYDITQAIQKVSSTSTSKVGLLSALNLQGGRSRIPGQPPLQKWVFQSELEKSVSVENLPLSTEEIPDDISLLIVLHPRGFSPRLQYALDQYVLRGGRLVVLLDPNARADMTSPENQFGQQPQLASDLPDLLKTWGVEYDSTKVVGDRLHSTQVNTGQGVMSFPMWMTFRTQSLDQEHPITAQLENLLFVEAGSLKKAAESQTDFTALLSLSEQSGLIDAFRLRFSAPDQLSRDMKVDDSAKAVMAITAGNFSSAFPNGQPAKEIKDTQAQAAADESEAETPLKHTHLNESADRNSILLFSDVDFLSDQFSVQKLNFLGQSIIQPTNDNLNLMLNAAEHLSGNEALMSIRSRGRFSRPFTRILAMQKQSQLLHQTEERQLLSQLDEVQQRLNSLLESAGKQGQKEVILPPEVQEEIQQFREEERQARRKLRDVRKILRQDIERLGQGLLLLNMLLVPLIIGIIGVFVYRYRTRQRRKIIR
ncbi:MAG: GldG family protein [SAR324 cluster bacterium]|nr:GldG family protein [SAR324 cluster bacterium]MDP7614257.1 GldG family protein [SAR324 cluster bacterium]